MDEKLTATFAKELVLMCVRNTHLENLHAGRFPKTKTGDYSDVKVVDGEGNEIPWNKLSRLDDVEMKKLMKEFVNKTYTFLLYYDDPEFQKMIAPMLSMVGKWDEPELDKNFTSALAMMRNGREP